MFIKRNSNVTIVNSLSLCEGTITRKRISENRNEKSVLDMFLVCDRILPHVTKMHIDEDGVHQLTNFYGIRNKSKVTETDHATLELHLDLEFQMSKPCRNEFFNFKNPEGIKKYTDFTNNSKKLSECFEGEASFNGQFKIWQHTLNSFLVQSFPKIRTRKRKFIETECGKLFETRKRLKLDLQNFNKEDTRIKLDQIEIDIANKIDEQFRMKVQENLSHLTGDDGGLKTNGMWAAKNSLIPRHTQHTPTAVKDMKGNLITNSAGIKDFSLNEIIKRL